MSLLGDLITGAMTGTAEGAALQLKGLGTMLLGGSILAVSLILLVWIHQTETFDTDNYSEFEIQVTHVDAFGSRVEIFADSLKFIANRFLWQDDMTTSEFTQALNNGRPVSLWTQTPNSNRVRGVRSEALVIDPSVGQAHDRSQRQATSWIAYFLLACGMVLLLVGFLERCFNS